MARKPHVHLSTPQKAAILKQHFVDKVPVSDLCTKHGVHVSTFYEWQKRMFEGGLGASAPQPTSSEKELTRKVAALEARLAKKDAVIAEVTGEYVALKKSLGEA